MEIIKHSSPNCQKMKSRPISCIVIHATATKGIDSPLEWLCNPASKVSAHYLIGMDGMTYQLVEEQNIAWHAGLSEWNGEHGVNSFSIGIELVNSNDGKMPYPDAQVDAVTELCRDICKRYDISAENVVGHLHVSPGRKNDPAGFDFEVFRRSLEG